MTVHPYITLPQQYELRLKTHHVMSCEWHIQVTWYRKTEPIHQLVKFHYEAISIWYFSNHFNSIQEQDIHRVLLEQRACIWTQGFSMLPIQQPIWKYTHKNITVHIYKRSDLLSVGWTSLDHICWVDLIGVARGVTIGVGCGGLCLPSSRALLDCRMANMFFPNV
jgi:hypothetical protein